MPTELDILADLDPLNLTKQDTDALIAMYRRNRARADPTTGRLKKPAPPSSGDMQKVLDGLVQRPNKEPLRRI